MQADEYADLRSGSLGRVTRTLNRGNRGGGHIVYRQIAFRFVVKFFVCLFPDLSWNSLGLSDTSRTILAVCCFLLSITYSIIYFIHNK